MIVVLPLLAALAGSVAQSAAGFGVALFIGPAMLLLLGPEEAVSATLIVASLVSVLMLTSERSRLVVDPSVAGALALATLPGVAAGAYIISIVEKGYLQIAVGVVVLTLVAVQTRQRRGGAEPDRPFRYGPGAVGAGGAAGLLNASISAGGPPMVLWLRSMRTSPDQLRHNLAVVFLVMNSATISALAIGPGIEVSGRWGLAIGSGLVGIPIGYALGVRVLRRLDPTLFSRLVFTVLCALATTSMVSGIVRLS